jgi:dinuclear metal center YbgI/SA1388 family protein
MILLKDLVEYLDKEVQIEGVKDFIQNGLQFQGNAEIKKAALSVDVTILNIKKAIQLGCDIIISHHPLISEPLKVMDGILAEKIKLLAKNNISVYVAHHPIDIHKRYSHGRLMADEIGLYGISDFGNDNGVFFGISGNLRKKMNLSELKTLIDKKIHAGCLMFPYGKKDISSISIISGGGGFAIEEAANKNIDCYVTGEMKHHQLLIAKDLGINVLLAGHYETEILGMQKLSQSITKKFKIESIFIES